MTGKPFCLLLALCLVLFAVPALAQNTVPPVTAKNTVFVEFLGNGGVYSLNYDRIFFQRDRFKTSFRVGASLMPHKSYVAENYFFSMTLPVEINGMWGSNRHHFEAGLGYTPFYWSRQNTANMPGVRENRRFSNMLISRIGYRYQRPEGGLFFRAALMPNYYAAPGARVTYFSWIGGGLSLGKSF